MKYFLATASLLFFVCNSYLFSGRILLPGQETYQVRTRREAFENIGRGLSNGSSLETQRRIINDILNRTGGLGPEFREEVIRSRLPIDVKRHLIEMSR